MLYLMLYLILVTTLSSQLSHFRHQTSLNWKYSSPEKTEEEEEWESQRGFPINFINPINLF